MSKLGFKTNEVLFAVMIIFISVGGLFDLPDDILLYVATPLLIPVIIGRALPNTKIGKILNKEIL